MSSNHGIEVSKGQSYRSIEHIAQRVRAVLAPSLGAVDSLDGMRLFENLDAFSVALRDGRQVPFNYGVEDFGPDPEALTVYDSDSERIVVYLSEETYGALREGDPRAKFTLGHEIGHAGLHANELVRRGSMPHAALLGMRRGNHAKYLDSEWQANAFSSALLMPADGLVRLEAMYGALTATTVSQVFGVSFEAARLRVELFAARRQELVGR